MQTCGKGLAERAALPAKLADIATAMSRIMELHQRGLVMTDAASQPEADAYANLETDFRAAADQLRALGDRMAGYRDLPMAKHDMAALSTRQNIDAFAQFVRVERELLDYVKEALARDEAMLAQMPRK